MAAINKSEGQLRAELHVARIIAVSDVHAERGVARVLVGRPQNGVVEGVDDFGADLYAHPAGQPKSLEETEIEQVQVRRPHVR